MVRVITLLATYVFCTPARPHRLASTYVTFPEGAVRLCWLGEGAQQRLPCVTCATYCAVLLRPAVESHAAVHTCLKARPFLHYNECMLEADRLNVITIIIILIYLPVSLLSLLVQSFWQLVTIIITNIIIRYLITNIIIIIITISIAMIGMNN